MGVAPGIKTDFYLYDSMDFCADLKNWTGTILKEGADAALVHSVSYGLQSNLTSPQTASMGCSLKQIDAVDSDFAKLAAAGVTIIFASGDSGSGYAPAFCNDVQNNTVLTGTKVDPEAPACEGRPCPAATVSAADCCQISTTAKAQGYTWSPPANEPPPPVCECTQAICCTRCNFFDSRLLVFHPRHRRPREGHRYHRRSRVCHGRPQDDSGDLL